MFGSIFMTDEVRITPITKDPTFGTLSAGTAFTTPARVEDSSKLVPDATGKEVKTKMLIFIPADVSLKSEDFISVTKKNGIVITDDPDHEIISISREGGFSVSHQEVYI